MGVIRFTTRLEARGPAAAIVLDDAQVAEVGERAKRFPVVATVNGCRWRTSVVRMGGEFVVGLNRAVRHDAGVEVGQQVDVVLELDLGPRTVEVPDALVVALAVDPRARPRSSACPLPTARSTPVGSPRRNATRRGSAASNRRSR